MVGVSKSYHVYPGDKLKIEAYGSYDAPGSSSSGLANFAAGLINAFALPAYVNGETGTPSAALHGWGALEANGNADGTTDQTDPKAFVNILLFDKNFNFLDVAYAQLKGTSLYYMSANYTVKEEGYAYLYVSNEQALQTNVYFDDVKMTYTPTNIIQSNEYYAYGLQTANSWTRTNTSNNFLYDAGNELNTTSGMYDLPYRNYDAALGRFFQVDPLSHTSHNLTPYHYAGNNPIINNDPSGLMLPSPDMQAKLTGMEQWMSENFYYDYSGDADRSYMRKFEPMGGGGKGFTIEGEGDVTLTGEAAQYLVATLQAGGEVDLMFKEGQVSAALYFTGDYSTSGVWNSERGFVSARTYLMAYGSLQATKSGASYSASLSGYMTQRDLLTILAIVQNGEIEDSDMNKTLALGPGPKVMPPWIIAGIPNPGLTDPFKMPMFQGTKDWDKDLKVIRKLESNPSSPWNDPDYPVYKTIGWGIVEGISYVGDRVLWTLDRYHNYTIRPWGYYKDVLRAGLPRD